MKNTTTFWDLWESWKTYVFKMLMTIPEDGLARLEGREVRKKSYGTVVLWIIICGLAIASITNLSARANAHKEGYAATAAGTFIALLVPVIVHYATKMNGRSRNLVWMFGIAASAFSGIIQYQVYAPSDNFLWYGKDNLEALVFGFGVPLAECALAYIAAIVESQGEAEVARESQAEEANRREQIEYELELEQRRADAEHNRKMQEIDAIAKADAKRIKAENIGKNSGTSDGTSGGTFTTENGGTFTTENGGTFTAPTSGSKAEIRQSRLVEMLHSFTTPDEINKTAIAEQLGVTRHTINRDFKALEKAGRISLNGTVQVNHQ